MPTIRLNAGAIIAVVFLVCALLFFLLVPEHLLRRANNFAAVSLDGRSVDADTYIGNPTIYESDAFLLIRTSGKGNYLFNFDAETFRPVSSYEFVPLHWAVFLFKPMSNGPWRAPLPTERSVRISRTTLTCLLQVKCYMPCGARAAFTRAGRLSL
jgi:hypothetical protein